MKIRSNFSIILLFGIAALLGLVLSSKIDLRLNPSRTSKRVSVSFYWANATAKSIETEVTSKLESGLATLHGVKKISSRTQEGGGYITLSLKKGTDLEMFQFEALSVIRRIYHTLPSGVSFPNLYIGGMKQSDPIVRYQLKAQAPIEKMVYYLEKRVIPQIGMITGVQSVNTYGKEQQQWNIVFNSHKCRLLDIQPKDIRKAIQTHLQSNQIGTIETKDHQTLQVWLHAKNSAHNALENLPLLLPNRQTIMLKEVADIYQTPKQKQQIIRVDGKQVLSFNILPEEGVNQLDLAKHIFNKVSFLSQQLPQGWELEITHNAAKPLKVAITTMIYRTLLSLVLLLLFVLWVTRSGRYVVYVIITLLVNIFIAIGLYWLFNIEVHMYALAGLTISLGMVIDNTIVMIDHLRHKGGIRVFWAILAATLTTIGALSVVFFQSEQLQLILKDFAWVVIIHLSLSLLIALYLIPALMHRFPLKERPKAKKMGKQRRQIRWSHRYLWLLYWMRRYRAIPLLLMVWAFGIPLYLIPEEIDENHPLKPLFDFTIGSDYYKRHRNTIEARVGGTLYQFHEAINSSQGDRKMEETKLMVICKNREGGTFEQLDQIARRIEQHLAKYHEIRKFITTLYNPDEFQIEIYFTPKGERSALPFEVKRDMDIFGVVTGGVDWNIFGVGKAYYNARSGKIDDQVLELHGYDYEKLYRYAQKLQAQLLKQSRVQAPEIKGETGWGVVLKEGRKLKINTAKLQQNGISPSQLYKAMVEHTRTENIYLISPWLSTNHIEMFSDQYQNYSMWDLMHQQVDGAFRTTYLKELAHMEEGNIVFPILKKEQQYLLFINFSFKGSDKTMERVIENEMSLLRREMPMGFSVDFKYYHDRWYEKDNVLLWLAIALFIIFIICATLLESIKQPLQILMVLPLSFTGVFFMFGTLEFPCDYGGYASFIMLCGIAVNAALYIVNDFNSFQRKTPIQNTTQHYMKAVHYKISPILLTILSTVLGLVPFLLFQKDEAFWYSFALGTIGGLIFSIIAIFFILPLLLLPKKKI
ncbi:efflux RND transporter permease subunit [Halosquirtibacter xylanolyticus]|uniref:efflux RND transporter permease subunit n=1 Tax=Halosquirtibacter xylanolyticus TaxID=3374599 RepID=UPI003749F368|nr:efflux RND transporter permease subunit [Prolixibacteraceae bacterium]